MHDIIHMAEGVVANKEANYELVAMLACDLEDTQRRTRLLFIENLHLRRSRHALKKNMNYFIKYFKKHRDELLEKCDEYERRTWSKQV